MSRSITESCGCKHDGRQWLKMCETHQAETDATAARWAADHIARNPSTNYTPEYRALAARASSDAATLTRVVGEDTEINGSHIPEFLQ
jgi:hypothetical protein